MRKLVFIIFCLLTQALFTNAQSLDTSGVVFSSAAGAAPAATVVRPAARKAEKAIIKKTERSVKQSLWAIFIAGFIGGVLAFFMPCIFPMLPMTIAFFTKSAGKKNSAVGKALIYGISIIVIYVVLGLLITLIFGPDALNSLSTNGVFNLLFFIMLVVFAASFLGAFELVLPSRWVNATDARSDKAGLAGLFFMAATLALVSFSCTGPIIGTLLVQAATQGALLGPIVGMFGYSLALALPFALFAMFPSWMQSLPKSGGWLNSVKVVLGFLELALSLKFLSNVDLAYHWHWFDREIFLVLWIAISALCGFYLLGKLKFSHDSTPAFITVPRLFLSIIVFAFTMYLVPGLWGAPLKSVSAFLPPMSTQDFDLSSVNTPAASTGVTDTTKHKYSDLFDKPKGFNPFFDYDEGLAYAKKMHKPVMIDFTGHACVNCRKMEANVWPDPQVSKTINQDYVLIQLYVDDKTDLPANEQTLTPEGRAIKTIGNKWSYLQTSKFVSNSQPFYVLLDPEKQEPLVPPQGANYDAASYLKYLQGGLKIYNP
ncbi:protein-disulfide reductase DsbD family protein [Mucilaginibacter ximonensis]|uniref:Protein-disulfide reductase DsbD family protein n=1 Tax=Mucilaginibacter ximonensis TaxID=538021 RepID=A0ABW5YAF3_9SPHI